MYLLKKSLIFFFLLIFWSLPNVIYLRCNLKDVLGVVALLSGDTANTLVKYIIIISGQSQYYFILVTINFLIRSTLLHILTLSLPAATFVVQTV